MSKYLKTLISIFAILIIGLIAFNSVTFVTNKNEYKVVKQFGEIKSISTEPGLNFKLPLIQSVSSIHYGCTILKINNPKDIYGNYFTGRETAGSLEFKVDENI